MTAAHDPRAWRVAIALGLESGLDWCRWAAGRTPRSECMTCMSYGKLFSGKPCPECQVGRPVPAPWDADAYLADCARRGVEPGPLPSLEHHGSDGVSWLVSGICATVEIGAACWMTVDPIGAVHVTSNDDGCEYTDLATLSRLATAAAKATVP